MDRKHLSRAAALLAAWYLIANILAPRILEAAIQQWGLARANPLPQEGKPPPTVHQSQAETNGTGPTGVIFEPVEP
jgi:hypothetical protein